MSSIYGRQRSGQSSFLKKYLWDSGLHKLFPKKPDFYSKDFAKDEKGVLTLRGQQDYDTAMDDWNDFYAHLRKNTDLSWAEPEDTKHVTVGVSPATMSASVKESVPNMFSGLPTYNKSNLYSLPQLNSAMSVASILNLDDKKKQGYF